MEEASSPTDSSLSDFIRKEKILKELYKENPYHEKAYNDGEIDNILQQMGKLLSPAGESDNKVYKQIIDETEKRSIEDILKEAKELISCDSSISDRAFSSISSDDLSNDDLTVGQDFNGNDCYSSSDEELLTQIEVKKVNNEERLKSGYQIKKFLSPKNEKFYSPRKTNINAAKYQNSNKTKDTTDFQEISINRNMHKLQQQVESLSNEIDRVNRLYTSCKEESESLKRELKFWQQEWQRKERQLLEENQKLSQRVSASASSEEFETLRAKLNTDDEIITSLERKFKKAMDEWKKKETKLIEERNHLRYKLQNTSRTAVPDVEKLHDQLKDAQETNVKLKLDMESYKDKCVVMENLCGDLKKVMVDENIVERVYANDNVPSSVKQFLSSSSSSMLNTLSHMFGCLSRNSNRNRFANQRNSAMKTQLFATNESLMINDLSKSCDYNDLVTELVNDKETLKKQNMDLNRQVKELEKIAYRRAHPNFSHLNEIIHNEDKSKSNEKENETIKNLTKELIEKRCIINDYQNQMAELRAKYEENVRSVQTNAVNTQEEKKEEPDKRRVSSASARDTRCKRKGRIGDAVAPTTRNYRVELTAKDKEIQQLHKQLEELKKTNKKLAQDGGNCHSSADSTKGEMDERGSTAVGQSQCVRNE